MEDRAVSLNAVINAINKEMNNDHFSSFTPYARCKDAIKQLPSVLQTGYWVEHEIEDTLRYLTCSECGIEHINKKDHFCPNCGADMRENTKTSKPDISSYYGLRSYVGREDGES